MYVYNTMKCLRRAQTHIQAKRIQAQSTHAHTYMYTNTHTE